MTISFPALSGQYGTADTRWAELTSAVVDRLRARTGFRGPDTTGPGADLVLVLDAAEAIGRDDETPAVVLIGWSGNPDAPDPAGSIAQTAGPAATTRPREEAGSIRGTVVVHDGDVSSATVRYVRDTAAAILTQIADMLRSDPTLGNTGGGVSGRITQAWLTAGTVLQYAAGGAVCEWQFEINYTTRL